MLQRIGASWKWAIGALGLVGCATAPAMVEVRGAAVSAGSAEAKRPDYVGPAYALSMSDKSITGQVCGMDVRYDVSRAPSGEVQLDGTIDGRMPSRLAVRDVWLQRWVSGTLGEGAGSSEVDLRLGPEQQWIRGRVGARTFKLGARGDDLRGPMRVAGVAKTSRATIHGRGALSSLPLPVQAVVLANLLTCATAPSGARAQAVLDVSVGGPPGPALPRQSSSLYSRR